ncbi:MAG: repair protein RadC [Verrucomicrobiota bacterium]|jgi:DNA repair protein RadC|nr:repair protein RadC [Verrucomicrobiota bacterium]
MRTNLEGLEHARWRPPDHITIQYTLHNRPSGESAPSDADIRLTRRLAQGARILQINMLDHVIVGQSFDDRPGYFSFKEAGMI